MAHFENFHTADAARNVQRVRLQKALRKNLHVHNAVILLRSLWGFQRISGDGNWMAIYLSEADCSGCSFEHNLHTASVSHFEVIYITSDKS